MTNTDANSQGNRIEELKRRVVAIEKNGCGQKCLGGMLSSAGFRDHVIARDVPKNKEVFRQRKWSKLKDQKSLIIDPFDPLNLTPFSYDLSIGDEAFSCRLESRGSFVLGNTKDNAYWMEPGDTIIVRTLEYIALTPCYSATVWPRLNFVREGIFQSMVKIDPTWYGQLGVALTNLSPGRYPIWKGRRFATLILYQLTSETDITLYRPGEILDDKRKMVLSLQNLEEAKIVQKKLKASRLEGKCRIDDDHTLVIEVAFDRNDFECLRSFFESEGWQAKVEKVMRTKTTDALGLPGLDLLLEKKPDGERVTRENVAQTPCTQQDLVKAAVERGHPFDLLANMPELVYQRVEERVQSELNK